MSEWSGFTRRRFQFLPSGPLDANLDALLLLLLQRVH
jgi:hypothetical protein